MIEPLGGFLEIHVSTPIEVCEGRDRKGLYAKARAGVLKEFTGVSDPYEEPEHPEMKIDTSGISIDQAAQQVLLKLENLGYLT
jgi:sulfate adenylyltransferase